MSHMWPQEQKDRAIALRVEGDKSAAQIARILNSEFNLTDTPRRLTRNSVLGFYHRNGVPSPLVRKEDGSLFRRTPRASLPRKPRKPRLVPAKEPILELPPDQSPYSITFVDATEGQCRYPLTATFPIDDFRFCGAPVAGADCSWCARHARMVFGRRPAMKRAAFIEYRRKLRQVEEAA